MAKREINILSRKRAISAVPSRKSGVKGSGDTCALTQLRSFSVARMPPDGRLSVVFVLASGSCPLVNYEYAGVSTQQPNPAVAAEIRIFLE